MTLTGTVARLTGPLPCHCMFTITVRLMFGVVPSTISSGGASHGEVTGVHTIRVASAMTRGPIGSPECSAKKTLVLSVVVSSVGTSPKTGSETPAVV